MKAYPAVFGVILLLTLCTTPALADALSDGTAAAQQGRFKEAVQLYGQAIGQGSLSGRTLAQALTQRGIAWMHLSKLDKAIGDFNQAFAADKTYPDIYRARSLAFEYKGQLEQAYVDAEWYAHYAPGDPAGQKRLRELSRKMMQAPSKGPAQAN